MSNHDDLQPDLQPVIDQLRANRPEATALELDAIKQRVRARVAHSPHGGGHKESTTDEVTTGNPEHARASACC